MQQGLSSLILFFLFRTLFSLLDSIVLLINQSLLALDISEHVFALGKGHKVGEHLGILVVEVTQFGQSYHGLLFVSVVPFEEFVDVVQDEVVFEYAYYVGLLVVY